MSLPRKIFVAPGKFFKGVEKIVPGGRPCAGFLFLLLASSALSKALAVALSG
jgi:hypothetical protein